MKIRSGNEMHGGRVYEAAERWNIETDDVIDFSANINPYGPPSGVQSAIEQTFASVRRYPDTSALARAISGKIAIHPDNISIGNGATGTLFAVVRAANPKRALIFEPAFEEYRRAFNAIGATVKTIPLSVDDHFQPDWKMLHYTLRADRFDVVVVNNPHNPSGALINPGQLFELASAAAKTNTILIIDEAFIDYVPGHSALPAVLGWNNAVVLRSLTKFYSIPGLRVGYAVSSPEFRSAIQNHTESWPVSSLAISAAIAAIEDREFELSAVRQNTADRDQFAAALGKVSGVKVFPSSANYLLIRIEGRNATDLSNWLEQHHILIRLCNSFEGLGSEYVRLAVRKPADNDKLVSLIEQWLSIK